MSFLSELMEGLSQGAWLYRAQESKNRLNACVMELLNEGNITLQEATALQGSIKATIELGQSTTRLDYDGVIHRVETTTYIEE